MNRTGWLILLSLIAGGCDNTNTEHPPESSPESPPESSAVIDLGVMSTIPASSRDDPASEGWATEAFTDQASNQLALLAKLLAGNDVITDKMVAQFITEDFRCAPLQPVEQSRIYETKTLLVTRSSNNPQPMTGNLQGAEGLARALREFRSPLEEAASRHGKFKIYHIDQDAHHVTTHQRLSISGHADTMSLEQHAVWICVWEKLTTSSLPRLKWIGVEQVENVRITASSSKWFNDCTVSVIGKNRALPEQLIYPAYHWWPRVQTTYEFDSDGHIGGAIGDINGDGLDDVYLCQPYGLPNLMMQHNPDGTVTDISAKAGVDWMERSTSALLIDFDNDGDQDLITTASSLILFMANDGHGNFELKTTLSDNTDAYSMAAADYDMDGDLDIYICARQDLSLFVRNQITSPNPYHDANNGGANRLIRNDGNWQLTDVTREVGLDQNNRRWSFATAWEDYDNDGDMDLYVANDYGRNNLYQNNAGRFTDVASTAGVEDVASGMSVTFGDYNRDGLMDLYVSNMFSAAGNRTTFQKQYQANAPQDVRKMFQRMARGNSLFAGKADSMFDDVSIDAAVTMGRWAWGSKFIDVNNDGWEDLIVANGNLTGDKGTKDL